MTQEDRTQRLAALDGYVERFGDLLYRVAWVLLQQREDAEDAVQDACLAWLRQGPPFESEEHARAWFVHVVRNRCRNQLRWRSQRRSSPLDAVAALELEAGDVSGTRLAMRRIDDSDDPGSQRLLAALLRLRIDDRELLTLIALGYSAVTCAEVYGCPPATLRKRVQRARSRLRRELARRPSDGGNKR